MWCECIFLNNNFSKKKKKKNSFITFLYKSFTIAYINEVHMYKVKYIWYYYTGIFLLIKKDLSHDDDYYTA